MTATILPLPSINSFDLQFSTLINEVRTIGQGDERGLDKIFRLTTYLDTPALWWQRSSFCSTLLEFPSLWQVLSQQDRFLTSLKSWILEWTQVDTRFIEVKNSSESSALATILKLLDCLPLPYPAASPSSGCIELIHTVHKLYSTHVSCRLESWFLPVANALYTKWWNIWTTAFVRHACLQFLTSNPMITKIELMTHVKESSPLFKESGWTQTLTDLVSSEHERRSYLVPTGILLFPPSANRYSSDSKEAGGFFHSSSSLKSPALPVVGDEEEGKPNEQLDRIVNLLKSWIGRIADPSGAVRFHLLEQEYQTSYGAWPTSRWGEMKNFCQQFPHVFNLWDRIEKGMKKRFILIRLTADFIRRHRLVRIPAGIELSQKEASRLADQVVDILGGQLDNKPIDLCTMARAFEQRFHLILNFDQDQMEKFCAMFAPHIKVQRHGSHTLIQSTTPRPVKHLLEDDISIEEIKNRMVTLLKVKGGTDGISSFFLLKEYTRMYHDIVRINSSLATLCKGDSRFTVIHEYSQVARQSVCKVRLSEDAQPSSNRVSASPRSEQNRISSRRRSRSRSPITSRNHQSRSRSPSSKKDKNAKKSEISRRRRSQSPASFAPSDLQEVDCLLSQLHGAVGLSQWVYKDLKQLQDESSTHFERTFDIPRTKVIAILQNHPFTQRNSNLVVIPQHDGGVALKMYKSKRIPLLCPVTLVEHENTVKGLEQILSGIPTHTCTLFQLFTLYEKRYHDVIRLNGSLSKALQGRIDIIDRQKVKLIGSAW